MCVFVYVSMCEGVPALSIHVHPITYTQYICTHIRKSDMSWYCVMMYVCMLCSHTQTPTSIALTLPEAKQLEFIQLFEGT